MNIAIIGAGQGGRSILAATYGLADINVVGIADLDENAPGMVLAREVGVNRYRDCLEMLKQQPRLPLKYSLVNVQQALIHSLLTPAAVFPR